MWSLKAVCRRRGSVSAAIMLIGLSLTAAAASQQQRAAMPDIEEVAENLYLLAASDSADRPGWTGGNTAVFVTAAGVVLVDTKLPGYGQDFVDRVRSVTDMPITMIINTHTHFDHSGSNNELPDSITVVAHENTRANMARTTCEPVTNCDAFQGENARFLPKRTYTERMSLFSGPERIDLYHFGRGHTNGDTFVVFRAARMMHTGDMFQSMNMPFIDFVNSGGSATEFAQTLSKAVDGISGVDSIMAGHNNTLLSWDDFTTFTAFMNDFLTASREGMEADTAVDAAADAFLARDHSGFTIDPQRVRDNMQAIYDGQ